MKKLIVSIIAILLYNNCTAQISFENTTVFMAGINRLSGKHNGVIGKAQYSGGSQPQNFIEFIPGNGSSSSLNIQMMSFWKKGFFQANYDGALYFMLGALGMKRGNPDNPNFYGSYTDKNITALHLKTPGITQEININNYNALHCIVTSASKYGLLLGGELDLKQVGTTSTGFTWFSVGNSYEVNNMQGKHTKIMIGPVIGYRLKLKSVTSVTTLAVTRNVKEGDFAISSNPSFTTTVFYGKNKGAYASLHYEQLNGPKYKLPLNGIDRYTISQLEIKLGVFLGK
jgi:hypothetical protein